MRTQIVAGASFRTSFAAYRAYRAQRREVAALLGDPGLSPAARQEIQTVLIRQQDDLAASTLASVQRRRSIPRRVAAPAGAR
ncbi:hypothetical protein [Frankia sp. AgKG'84/4]|uniref:hypothetical protein n=1 Tax=Frankia sp. AgKG'84/4 TaxID=573490 RepID=UPI00200F54C8|nr:hypothetical protein [Frankia sp. AgKG'84/4]MCL9796345.1 hypothetical protein [Frankia sp. AgKG'84/4]